MTTQLLSLSLEYEATKKKRIAAINLVALFDERLESLERQAQRLSGDEWDEEKWAQEWYNYAENPDTNNQS